jgi:CBS domain-containing membrane protein
MVSDPNHCRIDEEDLRAALADLKGYVDITEEDLMKIYTSALRYARKRSMVTIPVSDLMTRDVVTINREADLKEAARRLSGLRISGMPVVDADNRVLGIISEADILSLAGVKKGHTFKDVLRHVLGEPLPVRKKGNTVGEVMSSPAITTDPDRDIRDVASILDEKRIKRLPVVDEEERLVGIIARADIVRAMGMGQEKRTKQSRLLRSRKK